MKKIAILLFIMTFGMVLFGFAAEEFGKQKVLYVDSYHAEYEPSIEMQKAAKDILEHEGVELKFVYMDAKRQKSDEMLHSAALSVKDIIETWKPDLVIASDDAASKFLVKPYYKDADLPFVFIAVNWDTDEYGYPYKNVTGQIEVELVNELITELKKYSRGDRIGVLAGKTLTDQKSIMYYQDVLNIHFDEIELVDEFENWKSSYKALQEKVDILVFRNNAGILGWNDEEAKEHVMKYTTVPTGTVLDHLSPIVLISHGKVFQEIGEFGAKTALQILKGKAPEQIPISKNKQAKVYLNMGLARNLGIVFPMEFIQRAHLVSAEQKKLLYVNSYNYGHSNSDDIEKGLLKALKIKVNSEGSYDTAQSDVQIKVVRMPTIFSDTEDLKVEAALSVKKVIDSWKPDIVVTSDYNAANYLIAPYYKNALIPFVFSGLCSVDSINGLLAPNVTGIVKTLPILETIELLKTYAHGKRIGYIGARNQSNEKYIQHNINVMKIEYANGALVSNFDEWKQRYLELQKTVDMLLWFDPIDIAGWDNDQANEFILAETKIPTGCMSDKNIRYALLGKVNIAEEQGWLAGKTVLRILSGTAPSDIPIATNKSSKILLNMQIAKSLGIKFPVELIEKATIVGVLSEKEGTR
ncbi:MAG: ABC transporter substrate-binding protein [Candidatus Omnitrophica bacterium]|nr:ABC transporter substrate-binding protein [Candidatus Omnitrophota bacterium]MBU1996050.1 ABC transporter substrate-binding protein [Candidatus Omnitrophota bacterium]MBU4334844.1 ABC transporter substrate-binding protein [Candidatus Omnitrophota bacterium]